MLPNFSLPEWISRDAVLMISARGIRTFAQGYMVVLLAFYFLELGYNVVELGLFISVGIAGVAFFAFFVGLISGKVGRRWLLVFFSLVSGAAGLALILSEEYLALLIVAFVGKIGRASCRERV